MDDVDLAQAHMEKEAAGLFRRSHKPVGPAPNGRCHYCDDLVADDQRWCDTACRDEWTREVRLKGGSV